MIVCAIVGLAASPAAAATVDPADTTTTTEPTTTVPSTTAPATTAPPTTTAPAPATSTTVGPLAEPNGQVSVNAGSGMSVFARGGDGALWWRQLTVDGWSSWQSFGGNMVGEPAAVVSGTGSVFVFVRGADNQMWWQAYDGTRWNGWTPGGGVLSSSPSAAAENDAVWVFARGGDSRLYYQRLAGIGWSGWLPGGGVLASDPSASNDDTGVTVAVRGDDNGVWLQRFSNGGTSGWWALGGITFDAPELVVVGFMSYLFVRGTDSHLWWQRAIGAPWSGWQDAGGLIASTPAGRWDGAAVDVVARGVDDSPYWQRFDVAGAHGWAPAGGGKITDSPAVALDGSGLTVFGRGTDAQVYTQKYVGGWPGWTSLAGVPITSSPVALASPQINAAPQNPAPGLGFDTCGAPSTSAMQTWRLSSPYTSIGIYIGGEDRGCPNPELNSATWFNTIVAQGWRVIPIYVGLQAPCYPYTNNRIDGDVNVAYQQGLTAASNAINRANIAGLPPGSPIYFDLEAYDNTSVFCVPPVLTFISGWVNGLHQRGYVAGLYSSLCSGIKDQASVYNDPRFARLDAVWIAAWNNTPNLFGFTGPCAISDSLWTYHQRLHQYAGNATETWGGRTITIDRNAVDGPLAP